MMSPSPVSLSVADPENFWPLRLTAYEHYMLLDDRPSHPMTFCIEVLFEGQIQRAPLETALRQAIGRHPLLRATIRTRWGRKPCWLPTDIAAPLQFISPQEYRDLQKPEFLDITRYPGLRIWVVEDPAEPRIIFQFHHAAVDGVGALEYIGDVLAIHGQLTTPPGDEAPELAEIELEKIKLRGDFYGRKVSFREWLPGFLYHTWDTLRTLPSPLAIPSLRTKKTPTLQSFPPYLTRILETEELAGVKKVAARHGVSPNEIYTTLMLQTLFQWNKKHQGSSPRCTRICMPISLRTPLQDHIPSGNIISYMMLNARPQAMTSFSETLKLVHHMSREIIGTKDAPIFVRNLAMMHYVPGLVRTLTRVPFCMSTAVFANVGDVKRQFRGYFPLVKGKIKSGTLLMTGLMGAAPVRPGSGVATSVGTYNRRLFINMNYDAHSLQREDAEMLLDHFVHSLHQMIRDYESAIRPEKKSLHKSQTETCGPREFSGNIAN